MPQVKDIRKWRIRRESQTTIRVEQLDGTYSDLAIRTDHDTIVYDTPEIIPDYVKEAVRKMFRANYDQLVGFYHEHGYNIWRQIDGKLDGEALYEAGNSRYDSQNHVDPARGEDLITLNRYCEQTGREMAEEMGLTWGGCTQEESSYEEVD